MLKSVNLNDKTYEELLEEAISRIPLYSKEWTDFNRADPGITVLQNLTAFNHLQQMQLNEVTEAAQLRLLGLLGFSRGETRAARVLVAYQGASALTLAPHSAFHAGDIQFENEAELELAPWGLEKAVCLAGGEARDITHLLDRRVAANARVFGRQPAGGEQLYLFFGAQPRPGTALTLWADVESSGLRNPFSEAFPVRFARLDWQVYTEAGWADAEAQDGTCGFVQSGAISIAMPKAPAAVCREAFGAGYAVRCTLHEAGYDMPPELLNLSANLFELSQRRTCAATFHLPGKNTVLLRSGLAARGNLFVYCREEPDDPNFRAYRQVSDDVEMRGRYFCADILDDETVRLRFDRRKYGYAPLRGAGTVMVVCYDDEAVLNRALGPVYGYEEQLFDLPRLSSILPDGFCLLAEEQDAAGEPFYYLVPPGSAEDVDHTYYSLLSREGQVLVHRPAIGGTCTLYLASCAVSVGEEGNIRAGNTLVPRRKPVGASAFLNLSPGYGGASQERAEELRLRFVRELNTPYTAVTAADFEQLALATPGLCIHKVKALPDEVGNRVYIAVKPHSAEPWPRFSPLYAAQIERWLQERRMVATRIELVQPKYVDIDVKAVVVARGAAQDCRRQMDELLRRELDYAACGREFGDVVRYHLLFARLEALPGVQSVTEFSVTPRTRGDVRVEGPDIFLNFNCFARPGRLTLEAERQYP